jgi:Uma2 family endonuclease
MSACREGSRDGDDSSREAHLRRVRAVPGRRAEARADRGRARRDSVSEHGSSRIAGTLYALIWNHLEAQPIGEVFIAPFDVVMSEFTVVEPDLLYVARERAATSLTELDVRGIPNLVVEVLSKSTRRRDETVKRPLYERMGVTEYWLVDPRASAVRV